VSLVALLCAGALLAWSEDPDVTASERAG
jgi:hypothetical protein